MAVTGVKGQAFASNCTHNKFFMGMFRKLWGVLGTHKKRTQHVSDYLCFIERRQMLDNHWQSSDMQNFI